MSIKTSSVDVDDRKQRFIGIVDGALQDFQSEFIRRSNADQVITPVVNLQTTVTNFAPSSDNVNFLDDFNNSLVRLTQELSSNRTKLVETLDPNCPLDKHIKCVQLMQEAQKSLQVRYTLDQFQTVDLSMLIEQLERHRNDFQSLTDLNNTLQTLAGVITKAIEIFHGGIALLCIPVLIFLLFYLGLCFGTCGHRPYEQTGVCIRGVGANLLYAGIGFVFLFSTILMFVCVFLFLAGGHSQTELCRYLTGHMPDGPRKLDDYLHESVQYMIKQVRREARLN
ncbi:unnamed protein product [Echinostoma caproni]|uniref:Protein tweety homolog n=1 Tax=Echinostoma caproni TaxID=27848 RepID=A0A183BDR4_9TREM|nr:unnamed protein product [Echinostoma caproni]